MYFNMLGTDLVVLNSSEAIADLLDKRSAIYSDKVPTAQPPSFQELIQPYNSPIHQ